VTSLARLTKNSHVLGRKNKVQKTEIFGQMFSYHLAELSRQFWREFLLIQLKSLGHNYFHFVMSFCVLNGCSRNI
jgi:hypothetical protein